MARTGRAAVLEKQTRAIELLKAGRSYDEIASELGYANRGSAWKLVNGALRGQCEVSAAEYLQLTLDRLDAVIAANWENMQHGDHAAADLVLKACNAQAKLLGLYPDKLRSRRGRPQPDKPHGIVMTPEQRAEWEAAGSPKYWHR